MKKKNTLRVLKIFFHFFHFLAGKTRRGEKNLQQGKNETCVLHPSIAVMLMKEFLYPFMLLNLLMDIKSAELFIFYYLY